MNTSNAKERKIKKQPLILEFIGINSWRCPIYRDQHGHFWTDMNRGGGDPDIYSLSGDYMDAAPETPINVEYILDEELIDALSAIKTTCDFFLGEGDKNIAIFEEPQDLINTMKEIWDTLPKTARPEWLTWEQIQEYEKQILHPEGK